MSYVTCVLRRYVCDVGLGGPSSCAATHHAHAHAHVHMHMRAAKQCSSPSFMCVHACAVQMGVSHLLQAGGSDFRRALFQGAAFVPSISSLQVGLYSCMCCGHTTYMTSI